MKKIGIFLLGPVFLISAGFNLQNPEVDLADDPNSNSDQYSTNLNIALTLYTMWDLNNNRTLEETDWNKSINMYANSEVSNLLSFADLDKNNDDVLDINEFRDGLTVLNNQQLQTILREDPAKLVKANRLEIWDTDDDEMIEKVVAGDVEIKFDSDNN